jgi:hypothetical protein
MLYDVIHFLNNTWQFLLEANLCRLFMAYLILAGTYSPYLKVAKDIVLFLTKIPYRCAANIEWV